MNTSRQFKPWALSDDDGGPLHPTTVGHRFRPFSSSDDEPAPVSAPAAFRGRSRSWSRPRQSHADPSPVPAPTVIRACGRSRSPPRQSQPPLASHVAQDHGCGQSSDAPTLVDLTDVTSQAELTQDRCRRQSKDAPSIVDLTIVTNHAGLTQDQDWRQYQSHLKRDMKWWLQQPGIIDAASRRSFKARPSATSEGKQFRVALSDIRWALSTRTCEFKVGFATYLGNRWALYQQDDCKWTPCYLFLLCTVPDRVSAGFLEAGLIAAVESFDIDHDRLNVNWRNNDRGGTGPRKSETACIPHYIYLAVRPCGE